MWNEDCLKNKTISLGSQDLYVWVVGWVYERSSFETDMLGWAGQQPKTLVFDDLGTQSLVITTKLQPTCLTNWTFKMLTEIWRRLLNSCKTFSIIRAQFLDLVGRSWAWKHRLWPNCNTYLNWQEHCTVQYICWHITGHVKINIYNRNCHITFTNKTAASNAIEISKREDLYFRVFSHCPLTLIITLKYFEVSRLLISFVHCIVQRQWSLTQL